MTHIENKNKFDFDCNVGEYICQDSSVGEAISSSLNLDKNCTVYVNEVVCNERLNLGGDDADYVLKIPRSLGCKVVFDDVPIHVRLEANKLEEKIDCLHHPDSIHLAHCISKNATMISNDKNLIKACNELSVPAFYLEDLLSGFYSLEKLRNLSKYFPITERTIISTENKIWGGKRSMTFSEPNNNFEQSKVNGFLAEKMACVDFISNGYAVEKISHGGDFTVNKIDDITKRNKSIVEVKYNTSKLSKKQMQTKQKLKKNYMVYRVSESLLNGFKNDESAVVIPNTLSSIMGDNIQHGSKYRIAVPSECPHCRKVAITLDEVVTDFGLRIMKDGSVRDQSWCNECRWGGRK